LEKIHHAPSGWSCGWLLGRITCVGRFCATLLNCDLKSPSTIWSFLHDRYMLTCSPWIRLQSKTSTRRLGREGPNTHHAVGRLDELMVSRPDHQLHLQLTGKFVVEPPSTANADAANTLPRDGLLTCLAVMFSERALSSPRTLSTVSSPCRPMSDAGSMTTVRRSPCGRHTVKFKGRGSREAPLAIPSAKPSSLGSPWPRASQEHQQMPCGIRWLSWAADGVNELGEEGQSA
jgi:hypothetical protein